jgi:Tfp pilus assembly protein PilF
MSLINRMLLDLEQRQSMEGSDPVLAGLSSVDYYAQETHRFRRLSRVLLLIGVLVVAVTLLYGVLNSQAFSTAKTLFGAASAPSAEHAAAPPPIQTRTISRASTETRPERTALSFSFLKLDETLSALARSAATLRMAAGADIEGNTPIEAEVIVSGVEITPRGDLVDVNVMLTSVTGYAAYTLTGPDRLVMEITGARLGEGLLRAFDSGPVQRLRARNERGQSLLVFDLDQPARVETSELETTGAAPRLRVTLAMAPPSGGIQLQTEPAMAASNTTLEPEVVTPDSVPGLQKQPSRSERTADRLYQEGAELCRNGDLAAGLAKLAEVLARDPGHVDGRLLLATELMRQGDVLQAASILDVGLEKFPQIWQWSQLRAQIALNTGHTDRALEVLLLAPPPVTAQPDYHALLAAVQQRAGHHAEAVSTYHSVLGQHPERGVWWMGLGISLQALERTREAGFAFNRALEDSSLTPQLRSFIQDRMTSMPPGKKT